MSIYSEVNTFLTPENWRKGMVNIGGKHCLLGARSRIMFGEEFMASQAYVDDEFTNKISKIIEEQFPERFRNWRQTNDEVSCFNDHKDTTLDDIRLVLEKADADE